MELKTDKKEIRQLIYETKKKEVIKMRRTNNVTNNATVNATVNMDEVLSRTVINNAYSMCGKKIASVPVALMEIDDTYQRVLGSTVKKLMENWNDEKCNFLLVSFRDGRFYIIDGQHRYSVAKARGVLELPCIILTGLTQKDEALKFAQQQDNVNKLKPYDTFKANIACGDTNVEPVRIDMEIKRICNKYNVEVQEYSTKATPYVLRSISTARLIVRKEHGVETFERIMGVINKTNWKESGLSYQDKFILAINAFVINNENFYDRVEGKLIKAMNTYSPDDLLKYATKKYSDCNYTQRAMLALGLQSVVDQQ